MLKTPMAAINEFCMRHNVMPRYDLMVSPTKEYTCNLTVSCTFNEIETVGKGRSKKGAKHSAAYEALKLILLETGFGENDSLTIDSIWSPSDGETKDNYIKRLKKICENNLLPTPDYVSVYTEGLQLKRYTMQCRVSELTTEATAYNKKQAKQYAAECMIKKLLDLRKLNILIPVDNNCVNDAENADKENCNTTAKRSTRTLLNYSKINISDYYKISEMEEEFFLLNYAVCQEFERLADNPVDATADPKSIIDEISRTSEIPFLYFRVNRIRKSVRNTGVVYVALKSMTPPPWIVFGRGGNESEAERDAARKMLKFLRDMVASRSATQ